MLVITPVDLAQRDYMNATRRGTTWEGEVVLRNITISTVMRKWKWLFVSDWESNSLI
jgi:hypothetical protein